MAEVVAGPDRDACPLCDGRTHRIVSHRDREGRALTTALCETCGHVFTVPRPSQADLSAYYSEHYRQDYKGVTAPRPKHVLRAGHRALERLDQLKPLVAPGARLLDIGAGGGEFLYVCTAAGFVGRGIEPHRGYAAHARQNLRLDVFAGGFETAIYDDAAFDVATMHHVLEHLPEPRMAVQKIRGWLKPDGLLIVEVPNIASWYHAPRRRFHRAHIHSFNRTGLEDLMRNAGFATESLTLTPHTNHLNITVRNVKPAATSPVWRDAHIEVDASLAAHTPLAHVASGRPIKRLWANLKRPFRERRELMKINDGSSARAILDALCKQHGIAP